MRWRVFNPDSIPTIDRHEFCVSKRDALKLVASGMANRADRNAILLTRKLPTRPRPFDMGKLTQGEVYELLAADPNPQVFNGGLVRTETKPAIIPKFQGARVGSTE